MLTIVDKSLHSLLPPSYWPRIARLAPQRSSLAARQHRSRESAAPRPQRPPRGRRESARLASFWRRATAAPAADVLAAGVAPRAGAADTTQAAMPVPPRRATAAARERRPAVCAQTGGGAGAESHTKHQASARPDTGRAAGHARATTKSAGGKAAMRAGNRPDATRGVHAAAREQGRQGRAGTFFPFPPTAVASRPRSPSPYRALTLCATSI